MKIKKIVRYDYELEENSLERDIDNFKENKEKSKEE